VTDEGKPSGYDVAKLLEYDPADITNKLFSVTGKHFGNFKIVSAQKENQTIAAIVIGRVPIPLVFIKTGDYSEKNGKQKHAFTNGMVYFRHGAKSEPCTSDDLQQFLAREIDIVRDSWLKNIRKVVEAPEGSQIVVVPANQELVGETSVQTIRLVDDPNAPVYQMLDPNKIHPYRAKEVIELVNKRLNEQVKINGHDILAIRRIHGIDNIRKFYYRQHHGTPSYSEAFVEWLIEQYKNETNFFVTTKERFKELNLKENAEKRTQKQNRRS
jgi:hypothetical protein